jgi:hypothetical protein
VKPSVSVIVPFRPGVCAYRERAWTWLRTWWERTFPEWEIVVSSDDPAGPWRKAVAVDGGVRRSRGEILVIADADVFSLGVRTAVAEVASGAAWVVPHHDVFRLSEAMTARLLAGEDLEHLLVLGSAALAKPAYRGLAGGGLAVVPRSSWDVAPMDPRFVDGGAEDEAWGYALTTLAGPPVRLDAPLVHLWHPPQDRRTNPRHGGENGSLRLRYARAHTRPEAMRAILGELGSIGFTGPPGDRVQGAVLPPGV